jgi:hypothetical protein
MKEKLWIYSLPFLMAFLIYMVNLYQSRTGPHGGVYKTFKKYNIEEKTVYPFIYSYLLDEDLKPIRNKGIQCEAIFLLPKDSSINVKLQPFRRDGFIMKTNSVVYDSFKITYHVFGKSISEVFKNESFLAQKEKVQ